jgi:hypothetical protein
MFSFCSTYNNYLVIGLYGHYDDNTTRRTNDGHHHSRQQNNDNAGARDVLRLEPLVSFFYIDNQCTRKAQATVFTVAWALGMFFLCFFLF